MNTNLIDFKLLHVLHLKFFGVACEDMQPQKDKALKATRLGAKFYGLKYVSKHGQQVKVNKFVSQTNLQKARFDLIH